MRNRVKFANSEGYQSRYEDVPFGFALIEGCINLENPEGFDTHKRKLLREMRKRSTLAEITERINAYDAFFRK
ncbi:conserved hypothetical protein [delta proteobacterium NaphS2]|nr:conserved hypothetical protein [delta proteobacterium NaphS2]